MKTEKQIVAYLKREIKMCKDEMQDALEEEWYSQVSDTNAQLMAFQAVLEWYHSK